MKNTIKCIHCGKEIEISEAIFREHLETMRGDLEKQYAEKQSLEVQDLKKQIEEQKKKNDEFVEKELTLRKEKRQLEEREKNLELEMNRKMDEEKKKIEQKVSKDEGEKHRLEKLTWEKQRADMQKALEEAQRKSNQGSQQLQGEIPELELEKTLKEFFPNDEITPVAKGIQGADIKQIVKTSKGTVCGIILWESKQTKTWSDSWISKLKADQRAEKANAAIIVSSVLPKGMDTNFDSRDGIHICSYSHAVPATKLIRQRLIEVAYQKYVSENRSKDSSEALYDYVTGHEFIQQLESIGEVYREQILQIAKERAAFERIWKQRENQAKRIIASAAGAYGTMQEIIGKEMPQIKSLDLIELPSGEEAEE